ncbi:MAG: PQQ-binding-like beta-propeller repeat protein [Dehalococcoidia bacterium]|nr:PQQ-binding-like beta-propeller repeat protein [Dehalococcoidia bacterium]
MAELGQASQRAWMCRVCSRPNVEDKSRCTNCWANRPEEAELLDMPDADALAIRIRRSRFSRRVLRWVAGVAVAALVAAWFILPHFGVALFQSEPSMDISSSPSGSDWPMYQRDPTHSGAAFDSGKTPAGVLKWRYESDGPLYSSPAVVDGTVYLATGGGSVAALDAETGEEIWKHSTGGTLNSSPAVAGEMLFIGRFDGGVEARDLGSGDVLWEFKTGARVISSPVVERGVVYIGSGDGNLYALDAGTGRERWTYSTRGWISSSPTLFDDYVGIASFDGLLHVVHRDTGKKRLDFHLSETPRGSATFGKQHVIVADGRGRLKAVDWRERTWPLEWLWLKVRLQLLYWGMIDTLANQKGFIWGTATGHAFMGTPVLSGGLVYAANFGGEVVAADESTGEVVWQTAVGAPVSGSMSAVADVVLVGDTDGILHSLDAGTGARRWQFETSGRISATPIVADGVVYVGSWDGTLYAIE